MKNLLVEIFFSKILLLQNHFLGNRMKKILVQKFFVRKLFLVENFCFKINSSETVWMKNIW